MNTLEKHFCEITKLNPKKSSLRRFLTTIASKKYNSRLIHSSFKKLVQKSEYDPLDIKDFYFPFLDAISGEYWEESKIPGMKIPKAE
jgi:hypothetical protein